MGIENDVDPRATIGEGTRIWHHVQVREGAVLGRDCIVGRGAYIGQDVVVGDNCKIQNYALVYDPARLGDGVFIGPAVVLTNDRYPRAVAPDGTLRDAAGWDPVGVTIKDGASIGARSVCVAPVTIGAWAMVAAGVHRHPGRPRLRARGRRPRPPHRLGRPGRRTPAADGWPVRGSAPRRAPRTVRRTES
ncbi:MAG: acyltransferase [Candidatus Nanopelagicales bacterium]